MIEVPGESDFVKKLNGILKTSSIGGNFFLLWGQEFTGKNFFAQTYCYFHKIIPVTITTAFWQNSNDVQEFEAQLARIRLEEIPSVIIFDNPSVDSKLESLVRSFVQTEHVDIIIVSNNQIQGCHSWTPLTSWRYYEIYFPPLRERKEDVIPALEHIHKSLKGEDLRMSQEIVKLLKIYDWPKNFFDIIRLVKNIVGDKLDVKDLPDDFFEIELSSDFRNGIFLESDISFVLSMMMKYKSNLFEQTFKSDRQKKFIIDLLSRDSVS